MRIGLESVGKRVDDLMIPDAYIIDELEDGARKEHDDGDFIGLPIFAPEMATTPSNRPETSSTIIIIEI